MVRGGGGGGKRAYQAVSNNADGPVFRSLIISRSFTVDGLYFWMILSLLYWLCKISSPLILDLENSLVSDFQNEEGSND